VWCGRFRSRRPTCGREPKWFLTESVAWCVRAPLLGVVVEFPTAACASQQPHQATAHSARRTAAQKRTAPPGGWELKGAATAFRAWLGAARGTPAASGSGSRASFSGEPIFR
jgi:hypothetical protein